MTQPVAQPQFSTRSDEFVASGGLPLKEFWGNMQDIIPRFGETAKFVDLEFVDVEVIETEPGVVWPYPIAKIEARAFFTNAGAPNQFGQWWTLVQSAEILGYPDMMTLKNQRVRMKSSATRYEGRENCVGSAEEPVSGMCPGCGKDGLTKAEPHKEMRTGKDWKVAEVAGSGGAGANGASDEDALLALLQEPKNTTEFAQAVLANPGLKAKYGNQALFDGDVLAGLVASGRVVMDGDQYQLA